MGFRPPRRWPTYFLLLVQEKVGKENDTPAARPEDEAFRVREAGPGFPDGTSCAAGKRAGIHARAPAGESVPVSPGHNGGPTDQKREACGEVPCRSGLGRDEQCASDGCGGVIQAPDREQARSYKKQRRSFTAKRLCAFGS